MIYISIIKNCVNASVSFILNQRSVSWGHRVGAELGIGGRMCSGGVVWKAGHFCSPFQGQSTQSDSMDGIPVHSMQPRSADKYKVSLCSTFLKTQRRVHFNLVDHRNFIKYAEREISSSDCTACKCSNAICYISPSLQKMHNNQK